MNLHVINRDSVSITIGILGNQTWDYHGRIYWLANPISGIMLDLRKSKAQLKLKEIQKNCEGPLH
jgi:hypothetical protein